MSQNPFAVWLTRFVWHRQSLFHWLPACCVGVMMRFSALVILACVHTAKANPAYYCHNSRAICNAECANHPDCVPGSCNTNPIHPTMWCQTAALELAAPAKMIADAKPEPTGLYACDPRYKCHNNMAACQACGTGCHPSTGAGQGLVCETLRGGPPSLAADAPAVSTDRSGYFALAGVVLGASTMAVALRHKKKKSEVLLECSA